MNRREKILAGAIIALVSLWVLKTGYEKAVSHYDQRIAALESLKKLERKGGLKALKGQRAERHLKEWQTVSLTSDRREARAQYQQWLRHCATESRLDDSKVDSMPRVTRRKGFEELKFKLNAEATLDEVTRFLHDFYRADHLHKISRLHLKPKMGSKTKYDFTLTITALIVEGTKNKQRSTPGEIDRPQYGELVTYKKMIGERSLFAEYVPPKPPRPTRVVEERPRPKPRPKPPSFDEAKHTVMTAATSKSDVWSVWFRVRTTGKTMKLAVGDTLKVGTMLATVESIDHRQVVLATEKGRLLLDVGDTLSEGLILPTGGS